MSAEIGGKPYSLMRESLLLCHGVIQRYLWHAPIILTGEFSTVSEQNDISMLKVPKSSIFNAGVVFLAERTALFDDSGLMENFLLGREFPNVGEAAIADLFRYTGGNLFGTIRSLKEGEFLPSHVISHDIAVKPEALEIALRKIENMILFEDLLQYITELGGDYHTAAVLFSKQGVRAEQKIRDNPYIMISAGMPISLCEKTAKKMGIQHCDPKRMHGMVEYAFYLQEKRGDTRVSFHELCQQINRIEESEKNKENGYHTDPLFVAEEILSRRYQMQEDNGELYVYLRENFAAEERIAENIKRIKVSEEVYSDGGLSIKSVEDMCGYHFGNDQKAAFSCLKKSGVKVITGGPGTGKTTLLNGLIRKFRADHPGSLIVLCAPTGCAARRMQKSTNEYACTIHKLLNIRPYEDTHNFQADKMPADLIVVDESSMIDISVMARLMSCVKNSATILFIGDKDQLPSVGAGNVFSDLMGSTMVEVYHLNEIFRQNDRSKIVTNSRKIISGKKNLELDQSFCIRRYREEADMIEAALNMVSQCKKRGIRDYKVYTPSRKVKFSSGSIQINRQIQQILHPEMQGGVHYGYNRFSVGDQVIFTKNNYEKNYYNGQEGTIKDIQHHSTAVHVTIETEEGDIHLTDADMDDLDLGYAMTAHKSQGGECDNAIILIPKSPSAMLKRQLLYVEVTRARKNVVILSEGDAIETAISGYRERKRETGLLSMLN